MTTDYRALCAELFTAIQLYTGQNPAAAEIPSNELVGRLMDAMAATAAALAQPEPVGPTDEALDELWTEIDGVGAIWAWQLFARAVLSRWGRPALTPAPAGGLVERVAGAQFGINPYRPGAEETLARAAILAVADWLEGIRALDTGMSARWLRAEVERG